MLLDRRSFVVLGIGSLLAGCSTTQLPPPSQPAAPGTLTQGAIVAAINGARQRHGIPPWRYNSQLEAAARSHANLMAQKDRLSHDLGVTLRGRVTTAGYVGAVGENLAAGQTTLDQAIAGWLASPGHRSTLLSTRFVEFGLAVARAPEGRKSRYGTYWAMIAGGPFDAWRS